MKKILAILAILLLVSVPAWAVSTTTIDDLTALTSGTSADILIIEDDSASATKSIRVGYLLAPGSFTMDTGTTKIISCTYVATTSQVLLFPTNAAAASLQSATSAIYISDKTAATSFTVTTADGNTAAGTETFDYVVCY